MGTLKKHRRAGRGQPAWAAVNFSRGNLLGGWNGYGFVGSATYRSRRIAMPGTGQGRDQAVAAPASSRGFSSRTPTIDDTPGSSIVTP